ncbi:hypothetical protein [Neobacillus soli]|nr:hypothetical protein [Neobacillus soli]
MVQTGKWKICTDYDILLEILLLTCCKGSIWSDGLAEAAAVLVGDYD